VRVAQSRDKAHCVRLLVWPVGCHVYVQGDGVRRFVSASTSTFPECPYVDLYSVLGDSGYKRESADMILARYNSIFIIKPNLLYA
jgi:hypothetical protein